MGAVVGAQLFLKMVTSATTNPPSAPAHSQGRTSAGFPELKKIRQGHRPATITTASRMAVLLTVPWIVIAWAVSGRTPTKPPKDFEESAGFEVRNAVLSMTTAYIQLDRVGA